MGRVQFTDEVVDGWSRHRPSADLSDLGVVQRLVWSGRLVEELLDRKAKHAGFRRRGDYEVLALLRRVEPDRLSPNEVAALLNSSPSGMTGKLDRLAGQQLLERVPDPIDRRAIGLVLTDAGRDLVDTAFAESLTLYQSLLDDMSKEERQELDRLLKRVLSQLDSLVG